MNWQSYEEIVKDIYEKLGESNIEIICWGSGCRVEGKSGGSHQIDVLTSHSDGIHSYRTAIECKFWSKKVSKDAVAKLSSIIEDAGIEKGVIVSKSGFTPDAVRFARYKNIGLVELREPVDEDWKGRIRAIHIKMQVTAPVVYDCQIIEDNALSRGEDMQIDVPASDVFIHAPNGDVTSLQELIDSRIKSEGKPREGEEKSFAVPLHTGSTISFSTSDSRVPIREIRFKIRYAVTTEEIELRGEDHVFMIMLAIFENKRFAISPLGDIHAIEP